MGWLQCGPVIGGERSSLPLALSSTAALASAVLALGAGAPARALALVVKPARVHRPVDARVIGTFVMVARVTAARNVRGERAGQLLVRRWRIVSRGCSGSVCKTLALDRERSAARHDHLTLHRVRAGRYSGRGVFYAALRCRGRTYRRGSRVPYRITLSVQATATVEGIAFARRISASYENPKRSDVTPCPLGPSHDAAVYAGHARTAVPSPPRVSFSTQLSSAGGTASFRDTSARGSGGAAIASRAWRFGDPASGASDSSTALAPTHAFSAPGVYSVTLTVVDANGLASTSTSAVTVPQPTASPSRMAEASAKPSRPARGAGWALSPSARTWPSPRRAP